MTATTVGVRVLGFPLDVYAESSEHHEGLLREFALLGLCGDEAGVPRRLQALVAEFGDRYAAFTAAADARRDEAIDAGHVTVDLAYDVPPSIREDVIRLAAMLDEAEAYCRAGALLTLETPSRLRRFRRWYLREFVRQIDGEPPLPWPEFEAAGGDDSPAVSFARSR